MRKSVITLVLIGIVLVSGGLVLTTFLNYVRTSSPNEYPQVHIHEDGTIEPSSTPISSKGNLYTLEANITLEKLFIEKSNITLDWNGFSIKIVGQRSKGGLIYGGFVEVLNVENVILRNLNFIGTTTFEFESASSCEVTNCISQVDLTGTGGAILPKSLLSGETVNGSSAIIINNSHNILVSDMPVVANLLGSNNCTISFCVVSGVTLENSRGT